MKRTLIALLLLASMALTACTSSAPTNGTTGQIDPAKVQSGIIYLETTLATIESALAVAKVKYPEKAQAIDSQVMPVISELRVAISAFKAAASIGDYSKATTAWDIARPLVTTAISMAAPYAIGALVR